MLRSGISPRSRFGGAPTLAGAAPLLATGVGLAAVQASYGLALGNGFVSDDWWLVTTVHRLTGPADLPGLLTFQHAGWFVRPVEWVVTYALHALFGVDPRGYHALSQLVDLANALLVGWLCCQLVALAYPAASTPTRRWLAAVATLAFACCWRHEETGLWYAAINEPLALLFRLTCLNLYVRWLLAPRRPALVALASALLAALALLSKESAVTMPGDLVLALGLGLAVSPGLRHRLAAAGAIVAAQTAVVAGWAAVYLATSPREVSVAERSGLALLPASVPEWLTRLMLHLDSVYLPLELFRLHFAPMLLQAAILAGLPVLAWRRRQHLWWFALGLACCAFAPYVSMGAREVITEGRPFPLLSVNGTRYLYQGSAGVSLLVAASLLWIHTALANRAPLHLTPARLRLALAAIVAGFLAANLGALFVAMQDWRTASAIASRTFEQMRALYPRPRPGDVLCLLSLPDNHRGKYLFRTEVEAGVWLAYDQYDFAVVHLPSPPAPHALDSCTRALGYEPATGDLLPITIDPLQTDTGLRVWGHDLPDAHPQAGATLDIRLAFDYQPTGADPTRVRAQLIDDSGRAWGQVDVAIAPTTGDRWGRSRQPILHLPLPIDPSAPAGTYHVEVWPFAATSGQPLAFTAPGATAPRRLRVGPVTVQRPTNTRSPERPP